MEHFIRRENVRYYRELLKTTNDETERQKILKLLAKGMSNSKIAEALDGPKVGVVKIHCHHIYEKLHVRNRTEAAAVYLASSFSTASRIASLSMANILEDSRAVSFAALALDSAVLVCSKASCVRS